jgi:hypothetical protein
VNASYDRITAGRVDERDAVGTAVLNSFADIQQRRRWIAVGVAGIGGQRVDVVYRAARPVVEHDAPSGQIIRRDRHLTLRPHHARLLMESLIRPRSGEATEIDDLIECWCQMLR